MTFAWLCVGLGALLLATRYAEMPENIPVYRSPVGTAEVSRKSAAVVYRIAIMGIGQLGAATAMLLHSFRADNPGWSSFWSYASLAAGVKTLVECVHYAALGSGLLEMPDLAWIGVALFPVFVFLALAAQLWRRGRFEHATHLSRTTRITVAISILLWFGFAILPTLA